MTVLQRFLRLAAGRFADMQRPELNDLLLCALAPCGGIDEKTEGDRSMFHGNKYIAAGLAAGLAISALATPSFAQLSEGNAQRTEGNMSDTREKALRDCTAESGKMSQSTWGVQQMHKQRSCMMQHGEQE